MTKFSLPILNRLRQNDDWDRPASITLAEAVCIANREAERRWSCQECESFTSDDDGGDPPSASWPICRRYEHINNLKNFPFKRAQLHCFTLDYWASAYAAAGIDFEAGTLIPQVLEVWRRTDRYGRYLGPLEPQTEQWETDGGADGLPKGVPL